MQVNRTVGILVVIIVLLVGAVAFMIGQRSGDDGPEAQPSDPSATASPGPVEAASEAEGEAKGEADESTSEPEDSPKSAPPSSNLTARAVRIGLDGPHASACDRVGRVANLPGGADDFLAVREAPGSKAKQIDRLNDDVPFFLCEREGAWRGIVYLGNGTLGDGDECGLTNSVGAPRAYSGRCLTGWVHGKYVDASGAQDSE